jgi:hypothetical protein
VLIAGIQLKKILIGRKIIGKQNGQPIIFSTHQLSTHSAIGIWHCFPWNAQICFLFLLFLIFKIFIMKKLMLLMIGGAFVASSAFAQDVQPAAKTDQASKQEASNWEKKVKDELKLSDEQATKYDAISKEYQAKIDAVLSDAALTPEAQKEKKMALKKEKQSKLMEVLTTEQQAKYIELMEKKKKDNAVKPA